MNSKAKATAERSYAAAMAAYRQSLIEAEKQGQDSFDKTVISLAGGALGISFVFIKDVIGPHAIVSPGLLVGAWICWAVSTLAVLMSFFTSNLALRKAVKQCDEGAFRRKSADDEESDDDAKCPPPGGYFSGITAGLNVAGIAFLILGIVAMSAFVYLNLLQRESKHVPGTDQTIASHPTASPNPKSTTDAHATRHPAR